MDADGEKSKAKIRKIYVTGSKADIRVPMKEVELSRPKGSNGNGTPASVPV